MDMITENKKEIRFGFGKNWMSYVEHIDDERLENAKKSLKEFFGETDFFNKDFLDIGCGSGLFSLAAKHLGAKSVTSFDYDKYSVEATSKLKKICYPQAESWHILEGNVLDENFMKSLGQFDLVYSLV
jgi:ribosomal protein L11 methylase PrmA